MFVGILRFSLAQVTRSQKSAPCRWHHGPTTYSLYKYNRINLLQLLQTIRNLNSDTWHQGSPAAGSEGVSSPITALRKRLGYDTDTELRRFWRGTGDRLNEKRANNALRLLNLMQTLGVQPDQMKRHPSLLVVSKGWLTSRLGAVERLPLPLSDLLPLLKLPDEFLGPGTEVVCRDSGLFPGHQCRLDYLEQQLQSGYGRLCGAVLRNPLIMVVDAKRIVEVTEILLDGGVTREAILDDPYIYKHNIDLMRTRLAWIQEVGLTPIRPWMLRCLESTLKEHVERFLRHQEIMSEYEDEVDYLSHRLDLPRGEVSAFEQRYAKALRLSPDKMKAIVDVLLLYGYTGRQVAANPRVLCYGTQRTRERCERLRRAGFRPSSLLFLCRTPGDFDRYMAVHTGKSLSEVEEEAKRVREELAAAKEHDKWTEGSEGKLVKDDQGGPLGEVR